MKKKLFIFLVFVLLLSGCTKQIQTDNIPSGKQITTPMVTPPQTTMPTQTAETSVISFNQSENKELLQDIISSTSTIMGMPLNIDEDSCYLISTNIWSGYKNSIILVDHTGQIIHTFHDIEIQNLKYGKIPKKEPLIIGLSQYNKELENNYNSSNYLYGLYLPDTNRFIIEPQYNNITMYTPNLYIGQKNNTNVFFDQNGTILSNEISVYDYYTQLIGDFIWMFPINSNYAEVYNLDFERVAEIDCSNGYCYSYGNDYVIQTIRLDNNYNIETQLLDETGKVIISKEILEAHGILPYMEYAYIESIDYHTKTGLFIIYYGPYRILINKDYRLIDIINSIENPNDYIVLDDEEYHIYSYEMKDSDIILRHPDGNPIIDGKGLTYSHSLGNNTVYRIDDNTIKILKYNHNTEYSYTITGMTNPTVYSPFEDLYIIRYGNEPTSVKVFYKNSVILEKENYYWSYLNYGIKDNAYQIMYPDTGSYEDQVSAINTILDKQGNIVYKSHYKETIYAIDDNYIVVERGNYIGLVDFNGNFVFYTLNPNLSDD